MKQDQGIRMKSEQQKSMYQRSVSDTKEAGLQNAPKHVHH